MALTRISLQPRTPWFDILRRIAGKKDVGVILGWAALVTLLLLYNFHTFHQQHPFTTIAYGSPTFTDLERLALLVAGFVVSVLLPDVKKLTYGYFAAMAFACLIGAATIFAYGWYIFQPGLIFHNLSFGWEVVLLAAVVKVAAFMIPIGAVFSLLGVLTGSVVALVIRYA